MNSFLCPGFNCCLVTPSVASLCGPENIKKLLLFFFFFKRRFVGVTSCLRGTGGAESNISDTIRDTAVCVCVCALTWSLCVVASVRVEFCRLQVFFVPQSKDPLSLFLSTPSGHIRWRRVELSWNLDLRSSSSRCNNHLSP